MTNTNDWTEKDFLQFEDCAFGDINLTKWKAISNEANYDFNTELVFNNCKIESFNATCLTVGKKISFNNCKIGSLQCYAANLCGGFSLTNSVIGSAQFDFGVHNKDPHEFIITNCEFNDFLSFFDIFFEGPVEITRNNFKGGSNIKLYLGVPYGIKAGISCILNNNKGELDKIEKE